MHTEEVVARGSRVGRLSSFAAVVLGASLLLPPSSGAEDAVIPNFTGHWTNVAGDNGRHAISRGIENSIDDMFSLAKPTARSRLSASNPPIPRIELDVSDARVRYDLGSGRRGEQPHGQWRAGRSANGDDIQVRISVMSNGVLKMEIRADGASARHVFQLSEDGSRLTHSVRIHSTHLPDDVRYRLTYRRGR